MPRENGKDGRQFADARDAGAATEGRDERRRKRSDRADLDKRGGDRGALMHEDSVDLLAQGEFVAQPRRRSVKPQERREYIAPEGHRKAVEPDDLDHSTAGGDGVEGDRALLPGEREAIGAGMRVAGVDGFDADPHAAVGEGLHRAGEALIGRLPAEQAAEQPHVGALAVVGGGERSASVELDEAVVKLPHH